MDIIWRVLGSMATVFTFIYLFVKKKKGSNDNGQIIKNSPNSNITGPINVSSSPGANISIGGGMTPEMQNEFVKVTNERNALQKRVKELESERFNLLQNHDTANPRYGELEIEIQSLRQSLEELIQQNDILKRERIESVRKIQIEVVADAENDELKREAAKSLAEGNIENARSLLLKAANEDIEIAKITEAVAVAKRIESARTFYQLARIDEEQLRYTDALIHFRKAAELQPKNSFYLMWLGSFLNEMALNDEAITTLEQSLIYVDDHESGRRIKGTIFNKIGSSFHDKGDYDKAIKYYQKAIQTDKETFGSDYPGLAAYLNNIGLAWGFKKNYDKALSYMGEALIIDRNAFGDEHPNTARDYNNIGVVWIRKGDFNKAEKYFELALKIDLHNFGEYHPNVALRYGNMGTVWQEFKDFDKAIEYYQKALEINKKVYGPEHPNVVINIHNIGNAFMLKGDYDNAITNLKEALRIHLDFFGEKHPSLPGRYINLAAVYQQNGNFAQATSYYKKALKILKEKYPDGHDDIENIMENIQIMKEKGK